MKKSKLAAEIKFLKFCRKQHKTKLNELVRVTSKRWSLSWSCVNGAGVNTPSF